MYLKAKAFGDDDCAMLIAAASSPKEAKVLGRSVNGFDEEVWIDKREGCMEVALYEKFSQNSDLKTVLLSETYKDKQFVEASPYDTIWGIGINEDDPNADNSDMWRGENLLGRCLDKVRERILIEESGTLGKIFYQRANNPRFNTSYPIYRSDWKGYKTDKELEFSSSELSLYIHIPFCRKLCKFCEYVKYKCGDNSHAAELKYLKMVESEINDFIQHGPKYTLRGFDIGGGTPTALSDSNFERLINIYRSTLDRCNIAEGFMPSIEATFNTITRAKAKLIADAGIKRISFGMQTMDADILADNQRINATLEQMKSVFAMCLECGIAVINIDLMYGFASQTGQAIDATLDIIEQLQPEHLTLYELRTNMLNGYNVASKEVLFEQYTQLYDRVKLLGYCGKFGQNTFSRLGDMGLSSYLYARMIDNIPYRGFGIAAQSKNEQGIMYNVGKSHKPLGEILKMGRIASEDIYFLPPVESLSKYIAISGYCGFFRLSIAERIIGRDPREVFENELKFLLSLEYISIEGDKVRISSKGFKYYGAILSMFYLNVN